MDSVSRGSVKNVAEIRARVSEIQREIIQSLDEFDTAVRELGNPDPLRRQVDSFRELLTKLWLSNEAIFLLMQEQHQD
jgi:hypothetical protein